MACLLSATAFPERRIVDGSGTARTHTSSRFRCAGRGGYRRCARRGVGRAAVAARTCAAVTFVGGGPLGWWSASYAPCGFAPRPPSTPWTGRLKRSPVLMAQWLSCRSGSAQIRIHPWAFVEKAHDPSRQRRRQKQNPTCGGRLARGDARNWRGSTPT